jgi:hypothetical protein
MFEFVNNGWIDIMQTYTRIFTMFVIIISDLIIESHLIYKITKLQNYVYIKS